MKCLEENRLLHCVVDFMGLTEHVNVLPEIQSCCSECYSEIPSRRSNEKSIKANRMQSNHKKKIER